MREGYGKPPTTTRFKKVWSGNPKDQPKYRCKPHPYGVVLDQTGYKLHIHDVIKRYFQILLLVFVMLGMAGQAVASNPCDEMEMGDASMMSMSDCEEMQVKTDSSQSDDTVNCNNMLQCSPVPAAQVNNDIFVSQSSMVNVHVFNNITDILPGIISAPESKPPKPSIA